MHETLSDRNRAIAWFSCAGIAAVLLVIILVKVDDTLSKSSYENYNTEILREVRSAQTSLPSAENDSR